MWRQAWMASNHPSDGCSALGVESSNPTVCNRIGIDFGTTNICVGSYDKGNVEIYYDPGFVPSLIPSVVYYSESKPKAGEVARAKMIDDPVNTIFNFKRLLDKRYDDHMVKRMSSYYEIVRDEKSDRPLIEVHSQGKRRLLRPLDVVAEMLTHVKTIAERNLPGVTIEKAVIAVPTQATTQQKAETIEAAQMAGLGATLIHEPIAAAYAYAFHKRRLDPKVDDHTLLVFDLGGGTFDVSIVKVTNGEFRVINHGGDLALGGDDFDAKLLELCHNRFLHDHNVELLLNAEKEPNRGKRIEMLKEQREILKRCQGLKIDLTGNSSGCLRHPTHGTKTITVTGREFEEACLELIDRAIEETKRTLAEVKLTPEAINQVLLTGGSTRIPLLRCKLEGMFGPEKIEDSLNVDLAVAKGAALMAIHMCEDVKHTLPKIHLREVTNLSLGVSTGLGGQVFAKIVPRLSEIPAKQSKTFSTVNKNQTEMAFLIYEGERGFCKDNYPLGELSIQGLPNLCPGDVSVEFTLQVVSNGQLQATVRHGSIERHLAIDYRSITATEMRVVDMLKAASLNEEVDTLASKQNRELTHFLTQINCVAWVINNDVTRIAYSAKDRMALCKHYTKWVSESGKSATLDEIKGIREEFEKKLAEKK